MKRALLLVALSATGCGDDDGGTAAASSDTSSGGATDTSAVMPVQDPYGACGDPEAPVDCDDHSQAQCDARDDPATGTPYVVCAATCTTDSDCPLLAAGNLPPKCAGPDDARACRIECNLDANSCPTSMVCVDGDPSQCMWAAHDAPTHATVPEFCATVCDECGATLLLPWSTDCAAACEADLADCDEAARAEAFACTGGAGCPSGGATVADCLAPITCVEGT